FMSYFRLLKCDIASEAWRRTFSSLSPNMATENEIEQGRSPPVTALSKRRSKDRAISVSFGSNLLNGATFCCFDHFRLRLMLARDCLALWRYIFVVIRTLSLIFASRALCAMR